MMKAKRVVPMIVFVLFIGMLPALANGTTVTNNYDEKDVDFEGDGWYYHSVSKVTGNIILDHGQTMGNAYCTITLREQITTPTGEDHYYINLLCHYRTSFLIAGFFGSTFDMTISLQLLDDELGVDDEKTGITYTNSQGASLNQANDITLNSAVELSPNTNYWIAYHIYINFDGWIWMIKYPDTEYTYARMDLMYFTYSFDS